jgi:aspartyl-tRNA(Asn)/glutamyl-tRNA(Gln) amidotransferase subunit A
LVETGEVWDGHQPACCPLATPLVNVHGHPSDEGCPVSRRRKLLRVAFDPFNAIITEVAEPSAAAPGGVLAGRRLLVKDLVDTAGIRTTYGSKIYAEHVPSRDATVVRRARAAGAIVVGKANLPEFAWSVLGQNPWYGTVHNPTHPGSTTGGSSAGNAAALAAGLCDLGIGTDTGCSIRLPSAACGTVGLKPRWGTIPLDGVFPLVPTIDTVGPMGRSVADVALFWSVLAERPVPEPRLSGLTVGLLRQPPGIGDARATERSDQAEAWVADLERLGARVVEAGVPDATGDTWPMFQHEARLSHGATYPSRADEYGEVMQAKLAAAQRVSLDAVGAAYRALAEWRSFEPDVDLYVSPCYAVELPAEDVDELEIRLPLSSFLRWVNLVGWAGLAIGNLQLVAPQSETVLAAGLALERG